MTMKRFLSALFAFALVFAVACGGGKEASNNQDEGEDDQEAQSTADAYFKMSARRFVVGHGLAETDLNLRVGSYVNLTGLGPMFSGKYYVTEVRHMFDRRRGLRTEFTSERPGIGQA